MSRRATELAQAVAIKVLRACARRSNRRTFPRSRERGPVEARSLVTDSRVGLFFRAHVSAAPLKHQARQGHPRRLQPFRAHVSAAPLKPVIPRRSLTIGLRAFRAHVSAAPLKHSQENASIKQTKHFPRSRERGPVEAK